MGKSQNNMSTHLINEEKDVHLLWCSGCANKITIKHQFSFLTSQMYCLWEFGKVHSHTYWSKCKLLSLLKAISQYLLKMKTLSNPEIHIYNPFYSNSIALHRRKVYCSGVHVANDWK